MEIASSRVHNAASSTSVVPIQEECCLTEFCRRVYEFFVNLICCCFQSAPSVQTSFTLPEGTRPGLPEGAFIYERARSVNEQKNALKVFIGQRGLTVRDDQVMSLIDEMAENARDLAMADSPVGCVVLQHAQHGPVLHGIIPALPAVSRATLAFNSNQPRTYRNLAYFITSSTYLRSFLMDRAEVGEGNILAKRVHFFLPPVPVRDLPQGAYIYDNTKTRVDQVVALKLFLFRSYCLHPATDQVEKLVDEMAIDRANLDALHHFHSSVGCMLEDPSGAPRAFPVVPAFPELAAFNGETKRYSDRIEDTSGLADYFDPRIEVERRGVTYYIIEPIWFNRESPLEQREQVWCDGHCYYV